jgi:hypothetical protein
LETIEVDVDYCTQYHDGYSVQDASSGAAGFLEDGTIFCGLCEGIVPDLGHFLAHTHGRCCSGVEVRVGKAVKVSTARNPWAGVEECVMDAVCVECEMELDAQDPGCDLPCHGLV